MKLKHSILICLVSLLLQACGPTAHTLSGLGYVWRPQKLTRSANDRVKDGYWDRPAGLTGEHMIVIDTAQQKATYLINGRYVGHSSISSGKAGHTTPSGTFTILAKDINHRSSTYGSIVDERGNTLIADYTVGQPRPKNGIYKGAEMNYGMQITRTGIWMHEGAVTSAPESHGCIRLPKKMAAIFFENTPVGAKVIIK